MSFRGGRRLCIILTLLTVQAALIAQNLPDAPPSATFQSSTQLVQARVIAEDKDGKPVTDLRQDEFQFLDNGLSQDRESLEQKLRKWKPAMDVLPEGLKVEALRREIEQIAAHVAAIPGRKNLIWVAYRFPIASPVLQKLRIADVAVYPVDAHGSVIGLKSDKALANLPLRALAAATGGVAYFDRDDLDVAIREAIDDGRSNYTLGFYPSGDDSVSLVHQITVHVTRPGITLRYRNIYQTEPPRKPAPVKAAELVQAVYSPVDTLAIPNPGFGPANSRSEERDSDEPDLDEGESSESGAAELRYRTRRGQPRFGSDSESLDRKS